MDIYQPFSVLDREVMYRTFNPGEARAVLAAPTISRKMKTFPDPLYRRRVNVVYCVRCAKQGNLQVATD